MKKWADSNLECGDPEFTLSFKQFQSKHEIRHAKQATILSLRNRFSNFSSMIQQKLLDSIESVTRILSFRFTFDITKRARVDGCCQHSLKCDSVFCIDRLQNVLEFQITNFTHPNALFVLDNDQDSGPVTISRQNSRVVLFPVEQSVRIQFEQ